MPIKPAVPPADGFSYAYGDAIIKATDIALRIGVIVAAPVIVFYAKKKLGPLAGAFVTDALVQRELEDARQAGFNAVKGAVAGDVLHVSGVPAVIAQAAKYAIQKADVDALAARAIRGMGGPHGLATRIWASLPLPADATAGNTLEPALAEIAAHVAALPPKKQAALHPPVKR